MKKFRNVPAIMTLLAGFVTSVVMIVGKYELITFLWVLVLVMAGFYIAGLVLSLVLNKISNADKKKGEEQEDSEHTEEEEGTEETAGADAAAHSDET